MKTLSLLLVLLACTGASAADDPWQPFRFLVGSWTGEGSGDPGQGSGTFSFSLELEGKVLIRRNRSDYPATKDRPGFSHQDLMVVYPEGKKWKAVYFDNEGHVIQYSVEASPDEKAWTFVSDAAPSAPRFRLTYTKESPERLGIHFEIAPPGKPDFFSTYLKGTARRQSK